MPGSRRKCFFAQGEKSPCAGGSERGFPGKTRKPQRTTKTHEGKEKRRKEKEGGWKEGEERGKGKEGKGDGGGMKGDGGDGWRVDGGVGRCPTPRQGEVRPAPPARPKDVPVRDAVGAKPPHSGAHRRCRRFMRHRSARKRATDEAVQPNFQASLPRPACGSTPLICNQSVNHRRSFEQSEETSAVPPWQSCRREPAPNRPQSAESAVPPWQSCVRQHALNLQPICEPPKVFRAKRRNICGSRVVWRGTKKAPAVPGPCCRVGRGGLRRRSGRRPCWPGPSCGCRRAS